MTDEYGQVCPIQLSKVSELNSHSQIIVGWTIVKGLVFHKTMPVDTFIKRLGKESPSALSQFYSFYSPLQNNKTKKLVYNACIFCCAFYSPPFPKESMYYPH